MKLFKLKTLYPGAGKENQIGDIFIQNSTNPKQFDNLSSIIRNGILVNIIASTEEEQNVLEFSIDLSKIDVKLSILHIESMNMNKSNLIQQLALYHNINDNRLLLNYILLKHTNKVAIGSIKVKDRCINVGDIYYNPKNNYSVIIDEIRFDNKNFVIFAKNKKPQCFALEYKVDSFLSKYKSIRNLIFSKTGSGFEIGQRVFLVEDNFSITERIADINLNNQLIFDKYESASRYVLENAPVLSIKDVNKIYVSALRKNYDEKDYKQSIELEKIVKEKLQMK